MLRRPTAVVLLLGVAAVAAAPRASTPRLDPGAAQDVSTAITRSSPAVVGIRARIAPDRPSAATLGVERRGSGILVDRDGTVLTVGYLVLEANALEVVLRDGRTVAARVVGHDFESGLAVIRLADSGPYPSVPLGRSDGVAVGHPVSVLGMSEDGQVVARAAAVTSVRRFVAYWEYMVERALVVAPQHPAFGGAALVDADGALVGVVSLRLERENLAIPIDLFPPVREALVAQGRPARPPRPWLGVRVVAIDGAVAIAGVSAAGPARRAGLREGDVVVRLNGDRVADVEDFYRKLWRVGVDGDMQLTVFRGHDLQTMTMRPTDRYRVFQFRSPTP